MTIDDLFSPFVAYLQSRDRSPATVRGYLSDLRVFARWFAESAGEPLQPDRWTTTDVRAFREAMLAQGLSPRTVNRRLAALAAWGAFLADQGLVALNPTLHIRNLREMPLAPRWLTPKQRRALLRAVARDLELAQARYPRLWRVRLRNAALVFLLVYAGLRVGEVVALEVDDLRLGPRSGEVRVRRGKGLKERTVPLHREARRYLARWLQVRPPETDHRALFTTLRGAPLSLRTVQEIVSQAGEMAGIPNLTPHVLRHTFAKTLLESGASLDKVAALLGHSDLNTTRRYTTPSADDLTQVVERVV